MDSPSVDTTSGGVQRGRDNAQNVDGRKRHLVVDRMGLLLAVRVTAAAGDDAQAAAEWFGRWDGQPLGKVIWMDGDSQYHNLVWYQGVAEHARWKLVVVRRPKGYERGVRLPIRGTVERTFSWLGPCRRLSVDREKSVRASEAFVQWAMIHLMLNRLEPKGTDAEFRYRKVA